MAELISVVLLIGVMSTMAVTRLSSRPNASVAAEGFVRRLALDLEQSHRRAIATGDDHSVRLTRTLGVVTSYAVFRDGSGGLDQVDSTVAVPDGAVVTAGSDVWNYTFDGELTNGGASSVIRVDGANFFWNITVYHATGLADVDRLPQP